MNLSRKTIYIGSASIVTLLLILWLIPKLSANSYLSKFASREVTFVEEKDSVQLEKNAAEIENATRLTIAQIVGGIGLLIGLYLTWQNVKVAQDNAKTAHDNAETAHKNFLLAEKTSRENLRIVEVGKITERFSKAVEMLGNEKLEIRLGGIYALERIARDSEEDHWTVMEVLTAFVRANAPYNPFGSEEPDPYEDPADDIDARPREDIQAILTVIGKRKWKETESQRLNLQKVNLAGCVLTGANLNKANLSYTNLNRADLREAHLHDANLGGAFLRSADLKNAFLYGANFTFTNLIRAKLETESLDLDGILSAKDFTKENLSVDLQEQLKEWRAQQAEEKAGVGEDSSENQSK